MSDADSIELPPWAQAGERRRAHIARVVALLDRWAVAMALDDEERRAWRDAGLWHDALRDAPDAELRRVVPEPGCPVGLLHGPAAADRLRREGETREDVIAAVQWHTVGHPGWRRTGRALYMADYLEPGRMTARLQRAYLAEQVPHDFEGTFRQVVSHRLRDALGDGHPLAPEAVALWNGLA